ncbi:GNAT family N-acetyltransferase [Rhizobacter sp. LjRoot28]|uniref:GNAT family N-acetyltransferase n=1 Tax=Rhizobacter sp. LjRoot28 TaxID=3342309 RepID=UPI003ECEFABF
MTSSRHAAPDLIWHHQRFDELDAATLYAILRLRSEVFVVEQQCVYGDVDGKDARAHHVWAMDGDHLVAYARVLAPGVSFDEASIGRVVTAPRYRSIGAGGLLVARSIEACERSFGPQAIRIGAQSHLQRFYGRFGFVACSDEYVEDGIPHIDMLRA